MMTRAARTSRCCIPCDAVSTERLIARGGAASRPGVHPHSAARRRRSSTTRRDRSRSAARRCCARARDDRATRRRRRRHGVRGAQGVRRAEAAEASHIRVIDLYSVQPVDAATLHGGRPRDRAASSRSKITTRPAASATRWRGRGAGTASPCHAPGRARDSAQRQARRADGHLRHLVRADPDRGHRPLARADAARTADRHARGLARLWRTCAAIGPAGCPAPRREPRARRPAARRTRPGRPTGKRIAVSYPRPHLDDGAGWPAAAGARSPKRTPGGRARAGLGARWPRIAFAADLGDGFDIVVARRRAAAGRRDHRCPATSGGRRGPLTAASCSRIAPRAAGPRHGSQRAGDRLVAPVAGSPPGRRRWR